MINNKRSWIIIVIPLAILIVIFGYLVYQTHSISLTLNAILEQTSNNNAKNNSDISELMMFSNISSATTTSESQNSESSSGGQGAETRPFPYDLLNNAIAADPSSILSVAVRTAIIATLVFVIVKWLGGKGIGQLSPFGLLIVVGLGSAIGDPMLYKEISIPQAMAAVIIAVIFFKIIDYLTLKSRRFRDSLEPKPILLVDYGLIVKDGLKS